uniref:Uncharacterized protein n=1 Tax=Eunotia naegelii TaxID=1458866 RepID=A0A023JEP6_9STRA|nr:hypothetical protein [Eunotia naegelii]AHI51138.1 hypothetical protein [Eunotia naegelii]
MILQLRGGNWDVINLVSFLIIFFVVNNIQFQQVEAFNQVYIPAFLDPIGVLHSIRADGKGNTYNQGTPFSGSNEQLPSENFNEQLPSQSSNIAQNHASSQAASFVNQDGSINILDGFKEVERRIAAINPNYKCSL